MPQPYSSGLQGWTDVGSQLAAVQLSINPPRAAPGAARTLGHMTSPACHVPRAGPGQWSPPPFPHQVCRARRTQASADQRQTLVASGWQALPLDYGRGIILPFPALPLRVAPEHPGKPREVSTALGQRQKGHRRGDSGTNRGPSRASKAGLLTDPAVASVPTRHHACGAEHSRPRSLACTHLLGGGRLPQDNGCALRYKLRGYLRDAEAQQEGGSMREKTQ